MLSLKSSACFCFLDWPRAPLRSHADALFRDSRQWTTRGLPGSRWRSAREEPQLARARDHGEPGARPMPIEIQL